MTHLVDMDAGRAWRAREGAGLPCARTGDEIRWNEERCSFHCRCRWMCAVAQACQTKTRKQMAPVRQMSAAAVRGIGTERDTGRFLAMTYTSAAGLSSAHARTRIAHARQRRKGPEARGKSGCMYRRPASCAAQAIMRATGSRYAGDVRLNA